MRWFINFMTFLGLIAALAAWVMLPFLGAVALAVMFALWMTLTRRGQQTRSVTAVGLSTLSQRMGSSAVIVVGIAGVVGVLVSLLAMAEGFAHTLSSTGNNQTAIVLRGGSDAEVASGLDHNVVVLISEAPGVAKDAKGKPLASDEIVVAANLPIKGGTADDAGSVQLRGIGEQGMAVRPNVKIVEGRSFQPGLRELIVGRGAVRQFAGLGVGQTVNLGAQPWTVVGVFSSGDATDSEIWADVNMVADAYRRGPGRSSVIARLTDESALAGFKSALAGNPQMTVDTSTTLAFYSKQSEAITKVLRIIGITVGSIMGVGAMFGALNTMFAAVAARAREIATLRAIGFAGLPVVVAVMLETLLLALLGGALGGVLAWAIFDGYAASTLAGTGKLSFSLRVTSGLLWEGLKWALAIGMIGGIFPALRAATLPVTTALREL